jgi:hypothetical protein
MRLSTKAMAIAGAVIWGGCGMFLTGLLNQLIPPFGGQFLQTMSSVYPGYHVTSVVRQADQRLSNTTRARLTFSRTSDALAVQTKGLGLSLCLSM